MRLPFVFLLFSAGLSVAAGQWQVEVIDSSRSAGIFPYPSLAVDQSGLPYVTYIPAWDPVLLCASRAGRTWSVETVDTRAGEGSALAVDTAGALHAAYGQLDGPGPSYALKQGGWQFEPVAGDSHIWNFDIALDSTGQPFVAYASGDGLVLAHRTGAGSWSADIVDSTVPSAVSLRLNRSGEPCIAYHFEDRGQLWYARRDSGSWSIQPVDTVGGAHVGACAALALDPGGQAHIAYCEYGTYLKHARQDSTTWYVDTIDSIGYFHYQERPLDIEVDRLGRPCVSYYSKIDQGFWFAQKDREQWQFELVDVDSSPFEPCGTSLVLSCCNIHLAYSKKTLRYATRPIGIQEIGYIVQPASGGRTSIVRGELVLPQTAGPDRRGGCVLLSASGRKVADLRPGPNEVGRLAPGVYFVREETARAPSARKVILTR